MPPLINGQTVANSKVVEEVRNSKIKFIVYDIGPGTWLGLFYHLLRVFRILRAICGIFGFYYKREKFSVYYVYESGLGYLYNLILVSVARFLSAEKIYMHHHTSEHTLRKSKRFDFLKRAAGMRLHNIFLSCKMANNVRDLYDDGVSYSILENYSIVSRPENLSVSWCGGKIVIGYISNITYEKGFSQVLEVFSSLRKNRINFELRIAGPYKSDKIGRELKYLSEEFFDQFFYYGPIYGAEKEKFYSDCDILLFPSRYKYEAQPLVVLESLAHGKPCISSDAGYCREILDNIKGLPVVPVENYTSDTVKIIKQICASPDAYFDVATQCHERFIYMLKRSKINMSELLDEFSNI